MNNDRTLKLVRLCMDYRTPEPEALAALRALRNEQLDWHGIAVSLAQTVVRRPEPRRLRSADIMPFGKYKGDTISMIAEDDPEYLEWVLRTCTRLSLRLRDQINQALNYKP